MGITSRPAWARGLKRGCVAIYSRALSRPAWARGLKPRWSFHWAVSVVAPRVGAWIETDPGRKLHWSLYVAPRVGAWIETESSSSYFPLFMSRPAWARGLKHQRVIRIYNPLGRAPRGRVD